MRVTLERDGKRAAVEVDRDLTEVVVDGRRYPVTVVAAGAVRVELEIAGDSVVVDRWPEHFAQPPEPVDVNGERWTVSITREEPSAAPAGSGGRTVPTGARAAAAPAPDPPANVPGAVAVVPPMPGRVIEVRVRDGDRVRAGDALLVLEAMKMRNEIIAPVAGVVRDLRVGAGANARAREPMLFIAPE